MRAKKVLHRDKKRALRLMEERLGQLASEEGVRALATASLDHSPFRRQAAYSTYGYWLLQRLEGISDGVSILALWREIAYEPTGSPIKGFTLRVEDFVAAEESLVQFLHPTAAR